MEKGITIMHRRGKSGVVVGGSGASCSEYDDGASSLSYITGARPVSCVGASDYNSHVHAQSFLLLTSSSFLSFHVPSSSSSLRDECCFGLISASI
jgi:hypothetical protein